MLIKAQFNADGLRRRRIHHVITISPGSNAIGCITGQRLHHDKAHNADDYRDNQRLQPSLTESRKKSLKQCYLAQDTLLRL